MIHKNKVLCLVEDKDMIVSLTILLKSKNCFVTSAASLNQCLYYSRERDFVAIILSNLPNKAGVKLCKEIRKFDSLTPIIFFSASAYHKDREEVLAAGAQAYLIKPDDINKLVDTTVQLIELRKKDPMEVGTGHKGCFLR